MTDKQYNRLGIILAVIGALVLMQFVATIDLDADLRNYYEVEKVILQDSIHSLLVENNQLMDDNIELEYMLEEAER